MKFRTLLIDPHATAVKPVQAYHPDQSAARTWARTMLATASPEAYVTLYTEVEVEVYQWKNSRMATAPVPQELVEE